MLQIQTDDVRLEIHEGIRLRVESVKPQGDNEPDDPTKPALFLDNNWADLRPSVQLTLLNLVTTFLTSLQMLVVMAQQSPILSDEEKDAIQQWAGQISERRVDVGDGQQLSIKLQ